MKVRFSAAQKPQLLLTGVLLAIFLPLSVSALSRSIGRDIEFPGDYPVQKADDIRKVIRDPRFAFLDGIVSYWPPDWSTRLSFEGDAASLTQFMADLRQIPGIKLRLILYAGRDDEKRRDSTWQLDFSHARPDELSLYLNINSKKIDFYKIKLPEWPAP